jgi:hypothetical protein
MRLDAGARVEMDVKALVAVVDLNPMIDFNDGLDFNRMLPVVSIAPSLPS